MAAKTFASFKIVSKHDTVVVEADEESLIEISSLESGSVVLSRSEAQGVCQALSYLTDNMPWTKDEIAEEEAERDDE